MRRADIPNWPSFFEQFRRRPGMWFGCPSLTGMEFTIRGIQTAEEIHGVESGKRLGGFTFDAFEIWVHELFNLGQLSVNSFHLARLRTETEEGAFFPWFDWYDQFHSQRGETQAL